MITFVIGFAIFLVGLLIAAKDRKGLGYGLVAIGLVMAFIGIIQPTENTTGINCDTDGRCIQGPVRQPNHS